MHKFFKPLIVIILLNLLAVIFMSGCVSSNNNDADRDGVSDDIDRCPAIPGPKTNGGCPVISPATKLNKIHLYLDNSASMGGYYNNNTEYKNIIADLAVKMDKEIRPVDISFIADKTIPYPKNIANFINAIAVTPIASQKSSELHQMIKAIADNCGNDDVALLVSDCILSFPNTAIKANPQINQQNASSTLKNNIYATFANLKSKGFGANVYAFKSKFYGTYYDYQNKKTKLKGTGRPFYIWAIARAAILRQFNTKLEDISSFKPEQSLQFGLLDKPVNFYAILPELDRKGDWLQDGAAISEVEISKTEPIQIAAALNLQTLPSYAQNADYLNQNLTIVTNGCTAKFNVRKKTDTDKSKLHSENQIKTLDANTHVVLITATDMPLSKASIHFVLPLRYDTWYQRWSTMDDRTPAAMENKTFALEHLINGVKEAYETKSKAYIDFSLSLTK